ncbi:MAG: hypothetical protein ACRDS1_01905 [Pseudonocardiaceae bacterium]
MTAVIGDIRWATGPAVLLRVVFAPRVHGSEFGRACHRAGPGDPPVDLRLPPRADPPDPGC